MDFKGLDKRRAPVSSHISNRRVRAEGDKLGQYGPYPQRIQRKKTSLPCLREHIKTGLGWDEKGD